MAVSSQGPSGSNARRKSIAAGVSGVTTMRHINMLRANLRGPAGIPTRMIVLGNPGGPLHATIARMHVTGRIPWRPYELDDGSRWVFAPSTYLDNPTIDTERYARSIIASSGGDRALAEAWLNNNWADQVCQWRSAD